MTSSVEQPATQQTTSSVQENNGTLRSVIRYISNLKNGFIRRCGIYIDLLKLYTPVGYVLEKFRGPKTLEQWDPSKHMTQGFLCETIPLPDPDQDHLSIKSSNVSRITTWFSSSLLQAGKLALTSGNDKLDSSIKLLQSAIASKDQMRMCHTAKNLATILLSSPIAQQISPQYRQQFNDRLETFFNLIEQVEVLHDLDRKEQHLLSLNNYNKKRFKLPGNKKIFLEMAIKQAIPEMNKAQATQEDIQKAQRHACLKRKTAECSLHSICRQLERHQKDDPDYEKQINNTVKKLQNKMPDIYWRPDEHTILLLNALSDNVYNRTLSPSSPLISLMIKEAKTIFPEEVEANLKHDDPLEVYKLLNTKIELQTDLVNRLNQHLSSALHNVGLHMISALTEQGVKDPSTIMDQCIQDLQHHKFSTKQIKAFLSQHAQADIFQSFTADSLSIEQAPDTEHELEQTIAIDNNPTQSTKTSPDLVSNFNVDNTTDVERTQKQTIALNNPTTQNAHASTESAHFHIKRTTNVEHGQKPNIALNSPLTQHDSASTTSSHFSVESTTDVQRAQEQNIASNGASAQNLYDPLHLNAPDAELIREQNMPLDKVSEQHVQESIEQPLPPSFNDITLREYRPGELSSQIQLPDPINFSSLLELSDAFSLARPPNKQLIMQELDNIAQQIPQNLQATSIILDSIKEYKDAPLQTSFDILDFAVNTILNEIVPNLPSKENRQHFRSRLNQLIVLESLDGNLHNIEEEIQDLPACSTETLSPVSPPNLPHEFFKLARRVSGAMFEQENREADIQYHKQVLMQRLGLGQCMLYMLYKTMEHGISHLDEMQETMEGRQIEDLSRILSQPYIPVYTEGKQIDEMLCALDAFIPKQPAVNQPLIFAIVKSFAQICPEIPLESPLNPTNDYLERIKELQDLFERDPNTLHRVVDHINNVKDNVISNVSNRMIDLMNQQQVFPLLQRFSIDFSNTIKETHFSTEYVEKAFNNFIPHTVNRSDVEKTSLFDALKQELAIPDDAHESL